VILPGREGLLPRDPVRRDMIFTAVLLLFTLIAIETLRARVLWPFLDERMRPEPLGWLDVSVAIIWGFELVWSLAIGFLLGALLRSRLTMTLVLVFGVVCALASVLLIGTRIAPGAPVVIYFYAYGQYFAPIAGLLAGAWLVRRLRRDGVGAIHR
jgi:hypothetical protein